MRASVYALHGMGDFVKGMPTGFLTTLQPTRGVGDFIRANPNGFLTTLQPSKGMGQLVKSCACPAGSTYIGEGLDNSVLCMEHGIMTSWPCTISRSTAARGQAGIGCGSDCSCGPCRSQSGGMGQIDFSLTGTGIVGALEGALNTSGWPEIPNWVFYAAGIGIAFAVYQSDKGKRRR
jgi:hypothetical protein